MSFSPFGRNGIATIGQVLNTGVKQIRGSEFVLRRLRTVEDTSAVFPFPKRNRVIVSEQVKKTIFLLW